MPNVSLKPSTFSETLFWDDAEIEFVALRFGVYEFVNAAGEDKGHQAGLILEHKVKGADETRKDFYSYGDRDGDFFRPSADGKSLECLGNRTALNKGSNAAVFLSSLVEAGFDEALLSDNISVVDGCVIIGRTINAGTNDKGKPRLVRGVASIVEMPTGATKVTRGRGKAKGAAATTAAATEALDDRAGELIIGILVDMDKGELPKTKLLAALAKAIDKEDKDKRSLIQVCTNDEFLSGSESWTYANGMLTLV